MDYLKEVKFQAWGEMMIVSNKTFIKFTKEEEYLAIIGRIERKLDIVFQFADVVGSIIQNLFFDNGYGVLEGEFKNGI